MSYVSYGVRVILFLIFRSECKSLESNCFLRILYLLNDVFLKVYVLKEMLFRNHVSVPRYEKITMDNRGVFQIFLCTFILFQSNLFVTYTVKEINKKDFI